MKLSTLLESVPVRAKTVQDVEITGITQHSEEVKTGNLFICVQGNRKNGHHFAQQAIKAGAAAVVVQYALPQEFPQILVRDPLSACALLSAKFYNNPAERLSMVGVTGTNGKTTTAWLLQQILEQTGHKTGLLGTVKNGTSQFSEQSSYTTPEAPKLHALLARIKDQHCTHAVMEASSQALAQKRLFGVPFCCGIFTNLTPEHLDYHHNMEEYYQAKRTLFEQSANAVIWLDTPWGARLTNEIPSKIITCSKQYSMADYYVSQAVFSDRSTKFTVQTPQGTFFVKTPLIGEYNVENCVCAAAAAIELGVSPSKVFESLSKITPAPGRAQRLKTDTDFSVMIDYAHTPDGLQKVLEALRPICRGRLICLFGCGGDRDPAKRPLMGKIAAKNSDCVIVTSDNPRTEPPDRIIKDILAGMQESKTSVLVIEDRKQAIYQAIQMAQPNDMILLAGKGHETYQIQKEKTIPFDEQEMVFRAIEELKQKKEP